MMWLIVAFLIGASVGVFGMALIIGMRDEIDPYADEFREGDF